MLKFTSSAISFVLCLTCQSSFGTEINLYGLGHLSVDNVDDGQDSSIHVASNSSRLGVKGSHSLESGLTVFFQFESGLDPTAQGVNDGNGDADTEGQIFTKGRPSFIGLRGEFGEVLMGHMPALDQWANDYNLFADQVGDLGNLWEASGIPGRSDNVIYYKSPNFSGFDVAVTYVAEEGVDDNDHVIVKGEYATSKLKLGLALASIGKGVNGEDQKAQAITVGYDFGRFTLGGGFQAESDVGGVSGVDRDSLSVGGSVQVGKKGTIKLQYAVTEGDGSDSDASLFAIGYDYAFDKSTKVYIAYAAASNDANVNFSANGKGHGDKVTPAFGDDPNALSLGIVYQFDAMLMK
ncbi:MAG: porin [Alteromonadaceae bacterium]|nr:MAG: porin [Alteromonadaceae bacterium]